MCVRERIEKGEKRNDDHRVINIEGALKASKVVRRGHIKGLSPRLTLSLSLLLSLNHSISLAYIM